MVKNLIYKKGQNRNFFPQNRRGLSTIVITVILVALSMVAIVVVWVFVNNMIKKQISSSESCFGNFDKIRINQQYTCYDSSSQILRFSLMTGDVEVDKVIVSVSSANAVKSYNIIDNTAVPGLVMYSGANPQTIILPDKNSGLTYNATGFTSTIDLIQIAPVISGTQCEISDSVSEIEVCTG